MTMIHNYERFYGLPALTVRQPCARLILTGAKRVENRSWSTERRGELLIHAGKSRSWLKDGDLDHFASRGGPLVFGALLGVVAMLDCLHIDEIMHGLHDRKYPWLRQHEHTHGPWCWVFDNPIRFSNPHPCRGGRGLWTFGANGAEYKTCRPA